MASNQCTRPVYHDKANTHNDRSLMDKLFHSKDQQYGHDQKQHVSNNQHGSQYKGHTVDHPYYGPTTHGTKTDHKKKNEGHSKKKTDQPKKCKNKNKNKDGHSDSSSDSSSESDNDSKTSKKRFFY